MEITRVATQSVNANDDAAAVSKTRGELSTTTNTGATSSYDSTNEPAAIVELSEDAQKQKGVIRLLLEGHFKGVADVRLRINFAEELGQLELAQQLSQAGGDVDTLLEDLESEFEKYLDSDNLTEEQKSSIKSLRDDFFKRVKDLLSDNFDPATIQASIAEEFETFLEELEVFVKPILDPEPEVEVEAEEGPISLESETTELGAALVIQSEEEPVDPAESEDFLETLRSIFSTWVEQFESNLESAKLLPELSEPSGNGGAYDKFLAIYRSLQGETTEASEVVAPDSEVPVSTTEVELTA